MQKSSLLKIRLVLIVLLIFVWNFNDGILQSSNNSKDTRNIINKADSLFIAQNKPLTDAEWAGVVKAIYESTSESLKDENQRYQRQHRFNGVVMVAKDGVPVYGEYSGFSDIAQQIPFNDSSRFQLASVSKQFTAVAVLMLQQQNKLHIDSTLTTYLPELPYQRVTLRHLLHHEAGFPSYMWLIANHWQKHTAPDNQDIVRLMARHPVKLRFSPGTRFQYSNTGYCLLAAVLERVAGKDFDEFLDEAVFEPLNMDKTFAYSATKDTLNPQMVRGFRYYSGNYRKVPDNLMEGTFGDKNIYSTPKDLLKWTQGLYSGKILDKASLEEALAPSDKSRSKTINYGMGFRIYDSYMGKMVYHNGAWSGFRTTLRILPEKDLTVILLTNNSFKKTGDMARKLISVMENDYNANTLYHLASSFVDKKDVENYAMLKENDVEDFRSLQSIMTAMNREWMAHRIGAYADEMDVHSYEWLAMNKNFR
jgi:CubicO group peptidase (beta-lactamase class C family)